MSSERTGRSGPGALVLLVLLAATLAWSAQARPDDGGGADERAGRPAEAPGAPGPPTLEAADVCPSAAYLCAGLRDRTDPRVVRWNEDTRVIRVRVPRPDHESPEVARRLQRAAARGIRAWHGHPFPIRVDMSDRPGSHDFVVLWRATLPNAELGHAHTEWTRRAQRADLRVVEFALATRPPLGAPRPLSDRQVELTSAHEMGHALGLPHSDEPRDVMYASNTATALTARDYRAMEALYRLENGALIRWPEGGGASP